MIRSKTRQEVATSYRRKFVQQALVEWEALDGSIKEPLRKVLKKRLAQPHVPGSAFRVPVDKREDSVAYRFVVEHLASDQP